MAILNIIAIGFLLHNMVAIPILKEQIFLERATITIGGELFVLLGFMLIAAFNIISIYWVLYYSRRTQLSWRNRNFVLALGFICLFLFVGEKLIVDEIGREYVLGWEVMGEWIILYMFLVIQLIYALLILQRLHRFNNYNSSPSSNIVDV